MIEGPRRFFSTRNGRQTLLFVNDFLTEKEKNNDSRRKGKINKLSLGFEPSTSRVRVSAYLTELPVHKLPEGESIKLNILFCVQQAQVFRSGYISLLTKQNYLASLF